MAKEPQVASLCSLCEQGTEGHAGCRAATRGEPDLQHRHVSTAETPPPWDGLRGIQRAEMPRTHSSQRNCDYGSCGGERGRRADDARRSAARRWRPERSAPPAAPLWLRRLRRDRLRGPGWACWAAEPGDRQHRHLLLPAPPTLPAHVTQQL